MCFSIQEHPNVLPHLLFSRHSAQVLCPACRKDIDDCYTLQLGMIIDLHVRIYSNRKSGNFLHVGQNGNKKNFKQYEDLMTTDLLHETLE